MVAHPVHINGTHSAAHSVGAMHFMRKEQSNTGKAGNRSLVAGATPSLATYPTNSLTASRKTFECLSTSSFSVGGDMSAML